jgi:hypothetical protein
MHALTLSFRASRMVAWIRRSWAEIDYAERRMFELRTGTSLLMTTPRPARIEELEALYALEARESEGHSHPEL